MFFFVFVVSGKRSNVKRLLLFFCSRNPVYYEAEAIKAETWEMIYIGPFFISALAGSGYFPIKTVKELYNEFFLYLPCPLGTYMDSSSRDVIKECTQCPPGK